MVAFWNTIDWSSSIWKSEVESLACWPLNRKHRKDDLIWAMNSLSRVELEMVSVSWVKAELSLNV